MGSIYLIIHVDLVSNEIPIIGPPKAQKSAHRQSDPPESIPSVRIMKFEVVGKLYNPQVIPSWG